MVLAQQAWLTVDGERQLLAEGTIRIATAFAVDHDNL
jgi:hypothetical protein